jgi:multiple sugar transport system permease protein
VLGTGPRRPRPLPGPVTTATQRGVVSTAPPFTKLPRTPARPSTLPYLLLAPSLLFLAAFFVAPLVQTLVQSVSDGGALSLANYRKMAGDLNFALSIRNTFALVLVVIPVQLALALAMAMMLQKVKMARDVVLWIWTIPLAVSDLAAGLAWFAILQDSGYLNSFLRTIGVIAEQRPWLSYETQWTLFLGIAIAEIWRATAIVLVILVAGVQLIPREYGEAAEVFGASPWYRFRRVTLPLLRPSLQTALILRTVLAFEVFAVVYALGGRNFPVIVGEAFVWQNENQNYSVAAAYAVVVMAISLAATFFYLRVLRVPREQQA